LILFFQGFVCPTFRGGAPQYPKTENSSR